ncbi:hypothetical protein Tco_1502921, partial [Tanacetum coccineum]
MTPSEELIDDKWTIKNLPIRKKRSLNIRDEIRYNRREAHRKNFRDNFIHAPDQANGMNNNDDGVYEEHDVDEDDLEEDSEREL